MNSQIVYVAVDVGKRRCVTCVMDQDGSILDSGSYPNTVFDASRYARQMVERYGECKAVVESTGNICMKTYEAFEVNEMVVKLANPVRTRAIAEARESAGARTHTMTERRRFKLCSMFHCCGNNEVD